MSPNNSKDAYLLPALPLASWKETLATLHMWTQVVGKVRLKLCPLVNHFWNVPFYLTARGMTTSPMPYPSGMFQGTVEVSFDFIDHQLLLETSAARMVAIALKPQSVADFYKTFMAALADLGIEVRMWTTPCEVPEPIPFEKDQIHSAYDAAAVHQFWRITLWVDQVLKEFRAGFLGKVSPVHFFWGSFDLAVTRFSGRRAPERPGADAITREAYSHEVSSSGFWPGGGDITGPAFYSYAAPEPPGFAQSPVRPKAAYYHLQMKEFLLMYDDVRTAADPKAMLMEFLESTYESAAEAGNWDRRALER
ncbi:MAG TPA: DUF5996 family protein [Candidatus Sulfotelmatobacter sp.]|nr:DUF5996 family protein [Candidatus Sulfotelmatobacter sp.]